MNVPKALLEGAWKGVPFLFSKETGAQPTGHEHPNDVRAGEPWVPSCVAFSGVMCELGDDAGSGPTLTRFGRDLVTPGDDDVAGDPGS